jgi:fructose 1,6-bisphosphate aldolase/phosphatase
VADELADAAPERVDAAIGAGLLIDGAVNSCGDDVNLVMTHRHGVDAEPVHHFAWDTFVELTEIAKRQPKGPSSTRPTGMPGSGF